MASVRQKKKGIRAVSNVIASTPPEVSPLPRPAVSSPPAGLAAARERARSPKSSPAPPKAPARTTAAVQSARNKGKRSPSRASPSSTSPTHLVGGARGTRYIYKTTLFFLEGRDVAVALFMETAVGLGARVPPAIGGDGA